MAVFNLGLKLPRRVDYNVYLSAQIVFHLPQCPGYLGKANIPSERCINVTSPDPAGLLLDGDADA
jgi:hypothetical protein